MLSNLQIKDFLLIEELELDFYSGLTVITGETGSGKSITMDALLLIFGAKANVDLIRSGQSQASFAATFQIDNPIVLEWLSSRELQDSSAELQIICRRVIDINGRSKAYINSIPVTVGVLKELGELLLDIHTQHASVGILRPDTQRILVDEFAGVSAKSQQLLGLFGQIRQAEHKLARAEEFSQDLLLKQQILAEKISELSALNLAEPEWAELIIQQKQLANASFLLQELDFALNLLSGEATSLNEMLRLVGNRVAKVSEFLGNAPQILQLLNSLEAESNELEHELQGAAHKIEQNPELLAEVEQRIDEIYTLARKYRIQPEEILTYLEAWQQELINLGHDTNLELLQSELAGIKQEYLVLAQQVSQARHLAAQNLSRQVNVLLAKLAINGEFKIEVNSTASLASYGIDTIQYLVSFNPGMPLLPLTKVASGGELSRVALALYVSLSINNPPEVIIFDEVDVGIGGGVAEVVGALLQELGRAKQVICITHQAQTACAGNQHLAVSKQFTAGVSTSQTSYITGAARVQEIARMVGGLLITPTTLQHASEMLNKYPNYDCKLSNQSEN